MSYESEVSDALRDRHERQSVRFEARLPEMVREAINDGTIAKCPIVINWEICEICQGSGGHSRRFGTLVGEEMQDLDDEIWQRYARGDLDEPCRECNSTGKVQVLDEDRLSPEARQFVKDNRDAFYDGLALQWAERFC